MADLRRADATAPSLHRMDGDSLRGFIDAWKPRPTAVASGAASASAAAAKPLMNMTAPPTDAAREPDVESAVRNNATEARGAAEAAGKNLPMVLSVVLRVHGGRASAAALKTLDLSYDAGEGLFATLTHRSHRARPTPRGSGPEAAAAAAAAAATTALTRTKFCFKLHRTTIETRKIAPAAACAGAGVQSSTCPASSNAATFTVPAVRAAGTMRRRPDASPPPPPPPLPRSASAGLRFSNNSSAGGGGRVFESSQQSRGSQLSNGHVSGNVGQARAFERVQMELPAQAAMMSEVEAVVEVCYAAVGGAIVPCVFDGSSLETDLEIVDLIWCRFGPQEMCGIVGLALNAVDGLTGGADDQRCWRRHAEFAP